MSSISFTQKEFEALSNLFTSKYMDFDLESEEAEAKSNGYGMSQVNEYKAVQNIIKKMLRGINKSGTYYRYQLIDYDGEITDENIKEEYRI